MDKSSVAFRGRPADNYPYLGPTVADEIRFVNLHKPLGYSMDLSGPRALKEISRLGYMTLDNTLPPHEVRIWFPLGDCVRTYSDAIYHRFLNAGVLEHSNTPADG